MKTPDVTHPSRWRRASGLLLLAPVWIFALGADATQALNCSCKNLQAALTVTPSRGPVGTQFTFTLFAVDVTAPANYFLAFGDTSSDAGPLTQAIVVTHTYSAAGTYVARLQVADREATAVAEVTVVVEPGTTTPGESPTTTPGGPPPAGGFRVLVTASPTVGITGRTRFDLQASAEGGRPPYTWVWSFGDRNGFGGPAVSHVYPRSGTYAPTAVATDADGLRAEGSTVVTVRADPLEPTCFVSPSSGKAPLEVELNARSGYNVGPTRWRWLDNGDAIGETRQLTYVVRTPGRHILTAELRDVESADPPSRERVGECRAVVDVEGVPEVGKAGNGPPVITTFNLFPNPITAPATGSYVCAATDPESDGMTLTISLTGGGGASLSAPTTATFAPGAAAFLTGTLTPSGVPATGTLTCTAQDTQGGVTTSSINFSIN